MSHTLDFVLLIAVYCFLMLKGLSSICNGIPRIPYLLNLAYKILWSTVSEAFAKSKNTDQAIFLFSILLIISLQT